MSYSISKTLKNTEFNKAIEKTTAALKSEGFGVLTEIDIKETLKKKIDVDFKNYKILGACSPNHAYQALKAEDKIGLMLPCNVIVEQHDNGDIEVSAVDPIASMQAVNNKSLGSVAKDVQQKLKAVIDKLN